MISETETLQQYRSSLLEVIAEASDQIKKIDMRLSVLASVELEADLVHAERQFSTRQSNSSATRPSGEL